MKPILLLLLLLASVKDFACPTSNVTQSNWRWRNNDGNESTATWKAGQATGITYNTGQGVLRLRIQILNNYRPQGGCNSPTAPYNLQDSLQYTTNTANAGSWKTIGNDPSGAFVLAGANAFVTQGTPTTPQIVGSSTAFSAGSIMVSDSVTAITIGALRRTEVEWAIVGTANMLLNTNYYFRQYRYDNTSAAPARTYNSYPALNTTIPVIVKITRFTVQAEGNRARIDWETGTEQNNDFFEVQKSTDRSPWQTIATLNTKGNSTTPVSYFAYDENPPVGNNYYRLQQFGKDGMSTFSEVIVFRRVSADGRRYTVFPNPVQGAIRFVNNGSTAENVAATVSDASGKVLYRQQLGQIQAGVISMLGMVAPPAGLYFLKLTDGTTTETLKLIIK